MSALEPAFTSAVMSAYSIPLCPSYVPANQATDGTALHTTNGFSLHTANHATALSAIDATHQHTFNTTHTTTY